MSTRYIARLLGSITSGNDSLGTAAASDFRGADIEPRRSVPRVSRCARRDRLHSDVCVAHPPSWRGGEPRPNYLTELARTISTTTCLLRAHSRASCARLAILAILSSTPSRSSPRSRTCARRVPLRFDFALGSGHRVRFALLLYGSTSDGSFAATQCVWRRTTSSPHYLRRRDGRIDSPLHLVCRQAPRPHLPADESGVIGERRDTLASSSAVGIVQIRFWTRDGLAGRACSSSSALLFFLIAVRRPPDKRLTSGISTEERAKALELWTRIGASGIGQAKSRPRDIATATHALTHHRLSEILVYRWRRFDPSTGFLDTSHLGQPPRHHNDVLASRRSRREDGDLSRLLRHRAGVDRVSRSCAA